MPFQKILINTRFCIKCEMLLSLIMGDYRGTSLLTSFFSLLLSVEILFTIQLTKKTKRSSCAVEERPWLPSRDINVFILGSKQSYYAYQLAWHSCYPFSFFINDHSEIHGAMTPNAEPQQAEAARICGVKEHHKFRLSAINPLTVLSKHQTTISTFQNMQPIYRVNVHYVKAYILWQNSCTSLG